MAVDGLHLASNEGPQAQSAKRIKRKRKKLMSGWAYDQDTI